MRGQNLNLAFGTEVIYDDAEFYIGDNDKTGIVGVNGVGKTTLFRVLLGEQPLDSGKIHIGSARLGYLPQEIGFADKQKTYGIICSTRGPCEKPKRGFRNFTTNLP